MKIGDNEKNTLNLLFFYRTTMKLKIKQTIYLP